MSKLCFLLCAFYSVAVPQTNTDGYTPAAILPGTPAGSYILGDFDTLNFANMYVNFRFPLVKIGGRGTASTVLMPDFTVLWQVQPVVTSVNCGQGQSGCTSTYSYIIEPKQGGWPSVPPYWGGGLLLERADGYWCNYAVAGNPSYPMWWQSALTRLTYIAPDGTEMELVDKQTGGTPQSTSTNSTYNRGAVFVSHDGTSAVFTASTSISDPPHCATNEGLVSGTLVMRDGTKHTFVNGYETSIEDANGNTITLGPNTIVDQLGRSYQQTTDGACLDWTYPGYGGAAKTIKVCHDMQHNLLRAGQSLQPVQTLWNWTVTSDLANNNQVFDMYLISEIDLPDGSAYHFQYDSYGNVARVVLPTGGAVEYDYVPVSDYSSQASPQIVTFARHLVERREYLHSWDSTPSHISKYNNQTASEYDGQNHLLSKIVHQVVGVSTTPPTDPTRYEDGLAGKETETQYYAADGQTLLRDVAYQWQLRSCGYSPTCGNPAGAPFDPMLLSQKTTEGSLVKQTTYAYDAYNNVTQEWEGDWGAGSPGAALRYTATTYSASPAAIYLNILGLVTERKTFDSSGNLFADMKFGYDETPIQNAPGIVGHDGSFGTGYTTRGNTTSKSIWLNTTNSFLTTHYGFNIAGEIVSVTDPDGHAPTTLSYNDTCNLYANPLTVTNPLGQSTTLGYDYGTTCSNGSGKLIFSINPNGVKTAYSYNDPLDRLTQIRQAADTAAEAQTNIAYNGATDVNVYKDQAGTGDEKLHNETLYDGFGREIESRQYEGAGAYISTTKSYDALGRLIATSNPSRTTNGSNDGLGYQTTTAYDALGRVLGVTTPDGSATTTSYAGNQTTVSDPAGKARQYTYDGLQRLVRVVEDPSALNYSTTYTYDPLDDLTHVTQSDETRAFGYDSLKRLLWSSQPETGAINYHYDANGNVVWKDDNRGVETCYHYDSLNRVDQKVYYAGNSPDGAAGNCSAIPGSLYWSTPSVSYQYDAGAFGIGHLTRVVNSAAATNYLYDALGRVTGSQQIMGGQVYNFSYGYDLVGGLTSERYPSARVVQTTYDGAERASTVYGTLAAVATGYVTWSSYAPHGAMSLYAFGNNVWHATNYNSRLQPYETFDVINNDINKLLRSACLYWGGSYNLSTCGATNNTDNNGNLRATVFSYGTGGPSPSASFNETFSYDGVNRLTGVVDNGGWSRYFAYDQYSNMWLCGWPGIAPNGAAPAANYCSQTPSGIFNNANQIAGRSYDAAGNLLSLTGSNFTYDAENRITTVSQPGIGSVTYAYDGNDRRVLKINSSGAQTAYVYDANGRLAAEYATGAPPSPCKTCFVSTDHLGSTRLVTDQNGNIVGRHDYIPFGEEIAANSGGRDSTFGIQDFVNQKFTGKERDQETGLDYFGARYYGASLGRFTSPDPENAGAIVTSPQSWNAYSYVWNNPLTHIDPSGMQTNCATTVSVHCDGDQSPNLAEGENRYQALISGLPDPAFPQQAQQHQGETIWVHCAGSVSDFDCSPYSWSEHLLAASWQPYFSSPIGALFRGNQQLWSNTATIGSAAAAATGAIVAAPIIADAASSLTLARLAVGPGRPWGIHFAVGVGGTWLHWLPDAMDEFGNFSPQITTEAAEAWATRAAWRQIPVPILNPAGVLRTIGKPASNCLTGACYAIGQGWIP